MAAGRSRAVSDYLRRLGNPYASLEVEDTPEVAAQAHVRTLQNPYAALQVEGASEHETDSPRRAFVRMSQNPYASLAGDDEIAPLVPQVPAQQPPERSARPSAPIRSRQAGVSKVAFRQRCRSIFLQYVPPLEGANMRRPHREFISRNEDRGPEVRARLLAGLARYDLSDIGGLRPQFNRERDELTDEKLKRIEDEAQ
jgi:hypothetical protein